MTHSYSLLRWLLLPGLLLCTTVELLAQAAAITAITPLANARSAARTAPLQVTFNQPLTPAAGRELQVFSNQRGGRRTGATPASRRGNMLSFLPSPYAFQPGETVQYTVTAASQMGALTRPYVGQFTAAVGCTGLGNFRLPGSVVQVGPATDGMALGDLDGDGDLDLLVALYSANSNRVSVRFNTGNGIFQGTQDVTVGTAPKRVSVGDVDGDGDLDLLTANQGDNTISVRLNDGKGTFSGGSDLPVDYYPVRATLGDLDGDGDLDILAASSTGWLNVRLNDGAGTFRTGSRTRAVASTRDAVLGDVDGDGDLDVLATNHVSNTVSLRFNDGTGTFSGTQDLPVGSEPQALTLGDVDGDGDLDLLAISVNRLSSGIYANTVSEHRNDGLGNFTLIRLVPVGLGAVNLALGDIDGDGDLDLLTANTLSSVSLRLNDGQGVYSGNGYLLTAYVNTADLALGDVDGDGDLDLLTSSMALTGQSVSVSLNGNTEPVSASGLTLSGPNALCPGQSGTLTATSSAVPVAYQWNTGVTTASLAITQPGTYTLTATFADCQTASAEHTVAIAAGCSGLAAASIPNVLTPNGDQLNDYFIPTGLLPGAWALVVYNRWGRQVYRTEAYQNEWGGEVAAGLYYYHLVHTSSGTAYRGWLEVLR